MSSRALNRLLYALLLMGFGWLVWPGFAAPITDSFEFRQAQTALVASRLTTLSDVWAYEMPVLGPPWPLPFEFPLYQAIVKLTASLVGADLELTGRCVSVVALALCVWPLTVLMRVLEVRRPVLACSFLLLSPVYVFWGRAFLIETTALALALGFTAVFVVTYLQHARAGLLRWSLVIALGTAAGLTKVTTLAPFWLAVLCLVLMKRPTGGRSMRLASTVALVVVLGAAALWVRHTDHIKAAHQFGVYLTSDHLKSWNYGSWAQRQDINSWKVLLERVQEVFLRLPASHGYLTQVFRAAVALSLLYLWSTADVRSRRWAAVLALLYAVPFLVFMNLHVVHSYYQVANAVFLCAAVSALASASLDAAHGRLRVVASQAAVTCLLGLMVVGSISYWSNGVPRASRLAAVADIVKAHSEVDDVIVISGLHWSPVLPYLSGRRALMLSADYVHSPEAVRAALDVLPKWGIRPSLLVSCRLDEGSPDAMLSGVVLQVVRSELGPGYGAAAGCHVWAFAPRAEG